MNNQRQKEILIYAIIIFIICTYIASLSIHPIVDRGNIKDSISTDIKYPGNNVQGAEDENINNNQGGTQKPGNNNGGNTEGNNPSQEGQEGQEGQEEGVGEVVDNKDRIKIFQDGKTEWKELKELDIFKNSYFNDNAIIAPGVQGTYSFTIENISEKTCIYDINFAEENNNQINMVYKLKKNGKYIVGNEKYWTKYDNLKVLNEQLKENEKDIYTIEWKWQDDINDTEIGRTPEAYYKLLIKVDVTENEGE